MRGRLPPPAAAPLADARGTWDQSVSISQTPSTASDVPHRISPRPNHFRIDTGSTFRKRFVVAGELEKVIEMFLVARSGGAADGVKF